MLSFEVYCFCLIGNLLVFLQGNDVNVANKIVGSGESNGKAHDGLETVDVESMVCEVSDVCKS